MCPPTCSTATSNRRRCTKMTTTPDEGYMTSSGSGNDFYPGPFMVMAINAIDGSIINTMSDVM